MYNSPGLRNILKTVLALIKNFKSEWTQAGQYKIYWPAEAFDPPTQSVTYIIIFIVFAWADQRFYSSITTILFEVGSYRTVVG